MSNDKWLTEREIQEMIGESVDEFVPVASDDENQAEPEAVEEPAVRMVEPEEEVVVMVEEPPENTLETKQEVANRMGGKTPETKEEKEIIARRLSGQTAAKFRSIRKNSPLLKRKYLGKARNY